MPFYNQVTASKKINELDEENKKLNSKLEEVLKNQLNEREGFMEIATSINLLKIEQFKINEKINDIRDKFCQKPKLEELSTELSTLLEFNGLDKYAENLKFVGVSSIEDLLLLDINDLNENGILYMIVKRYYQQLSLLIENRDTLN